MKLFYYSSIILVLAGTVLAQSYSPGLPLPGLPKSLGQKTMANSTSVTVASDQNLNVSTTVNSLNASITTNYTLAPGSSTLIGYIDPNGKIQPFLGSSTGITVSSTQSTVASSSISRTSNITTNATLVSSNGSRKGLFLFNDSATANCYVKFGTVATTVSYSIKLFPTDTYIMDAPVYTGQVDDICDVASGSMQVTEQ